MGSRREARRAGTSGDSGDEREDGGSHGKRGGIVCFHTIEEARDETRDAEREHKADR